MRRYLLIGTGTGVTPVSRDAAAAGTRRSPRRGIEVVLLFGARTPE